MTVTKRFLAMCGILAGLSLVAMADPVDPDILLDPSLGDLTVLTYSGEPIDITIPNCVGPCPASFTDTFENDTGAVIDSFTFTFTHTNIQSALSSFTCPVSDSFFLNCKVTSPDANDIVYSFFGVNPADTETDPCDTEGGEQEGIPVFSASCTTGKGIFNITFNGWEQLYAGDSVDGTFTTVPEPAPLPMLAVVLLGIGGLLVRRKVFGRG